MGAHGSKQKVDSIMKWWGDTLQEAFGESQQPDQTPSAPPPTPEQTPEQTPERTPTSLPALNTNENPADEARPENFITPERPPPTLFGWSPSSLQEEYRSGGSGVVKSPPELFGEKDKRVFIF